MAQKQTAERERESEYPSYLAIMCPTVFCLFVNLWLLMEVVLTDLKPNALLSFSHRMTETQGRVQRL